MVLTIKDKSSWDFIIRNALQRVLGESYINVILENSGKIIYQNCDDEACNLFLHKISRDDLIQVMMEELLKNFTYVTAYHACKLSSVENYYTNGILPLSLLDVQLKFKMLFSSYMSDNDIQQVIDNVCTKTRGGHVYTLLDDRVFYEQSGHYLIYGGEYLQCLAVALAGDSTINRDILKNQGRATIFICKLPFSLIKHLRSLTQRLMADHFFRVAHGVKEVSVIDYGVSMKSKINPDQIVDHFHPTKIKDPFNCRAAWNDEYRQYE